MSGGPGGYGSPAPLGGVSSSICNDSESGVNYLSANYLQAMVKYKD